MTIEEYIEEEDEYQSQGTKISSFVDRKEAKDLFSTIYEYMSDRANSGDRVLYYWGVGGIGKSSLMSEIQTIAGKNNCVHHDLDSSCNEIEILYSLRKQLEKRNKMFVFPRFDIAVSAYIKKVGKQYNVKQEDDDNEIIEISSSIFDSLISTFSDIFSSNVYLPYISDLKAVGAAGYKAFKYLLGELSKKKKEYASDYETISYYLQDSKPDATSALLKTVKDCFIKDYNEAISQLVTESDFKPIVVFIDTLEKLLFKDSSIVENSEESCQWLLNSDTGLIHYLKRTLVVMCGRDALDFDNCFDLYKKNDKYYLLQHYAQNKHIDIEQLSYPSIASACRDEYKLINPSHSGHFVIGYELNLLDENFVIEILQINNINDVNIQKQICDTSKGMPLYVMLCVEIYNTKKGNVTVDDFKGDIRSLSKRLLTGFSDDEVDIIIKMSLIGNWTDEEMFFLMDTDVENLNTVAARKYYSLLKHSFIRKEDETRFIFHDVVRECIYESEFNAEIKIKRSNINKLIALYKKQVVNANQENIDYQISRIKDLISKVIDVQQVLQVFDIVNMLDNIIGFSDNGIKTIYMSLYDKAISLNANSLEIKDLIYKTANELHECFKNDEALQLIADLESVDPNNFKYSLLKIDCLLASEKSHKALEIAKKLNDEYKQDDVEFADYIEILHSLGRSNSAMGNYDEALNISKRIYELNKEKNGEENKNSINCLRNLAYSYALVDDQSMCIECLKQAYETSEHLYGRLYPLTIDILLELVYKYCDVDNCDEAIKNNLQAYEDCRANYGDNNPKTRETLRSLKDCYLSAGEYQKAFDIASEQYEYFKNTYGENYFLSIEALDDLRDAYMYMGNKEKLHEISKLNYEKNLENYGRSDYRTLTALEWLVRYYLYQEENYEAAKQACEELYAGKNKLYGPKSTLDLLGEVYRKCKDYELEYETYKKKYEIAKKENGELNRHTLYALLDMANFKQEHGMHDEALVLYKKIYDDRSQMLDNDNPLLLRSLLDLADAYYNVKDYDKALSSCEYVYDKYLQLFADDEEKIAKSKNLLDKINDALSKSND